MSRTVVYPDAEAFFAAVEHADPKVRRGGQSGGGERHGIIAPSVLQNVTGIASTKFNPHPSEIVADYLRTL